MTSMTIALQNTVILTDAVVERVPAAVHVDGGEEQIAFGGHLPGSEDACGRFLNVTLAQLHHVRPLGGILDHLQDIVVRSGSGELPSLANAGSSLVPLCIKTFASPPSSTSCSHPSAPGTVSICSVHHQIVCNRLSCPLEAFAIPAVVCSYVHTCRRCCLTPTVP